MRDNFNKLNSFKTGGDAKASLGFAVADHVSAMLAYWDKDLVCRFANNAYREWFGKTKEEMINKITMRDLLGPLYEKNLPYILGALGGKMQTFEREITLPNGETRHSIANYFPDIEKKKVKGFFVHVADVTSLKNVQLQLKEKENELVELNKYKDKLVSVLAHDLRNYVTINHTTIEYLLSDYNNISKEEILKYLQILKRNNLHTVHFLDDLSDWVKNVLQKIIYKPKKLKIEKEIKSVIALFDKLLVDKKLSVRTRLKDVPDAYADADMFHTVMRNLLSNAIKFSYAGSEIFITAKLKSDSIIVSVKDYGIGMSEKEKNKIMAGSGYQSSQGTNGEKGVGVGMSLTKEFIEKNGGTMSVKSAIGKGSTFYFSTPLFKAKRKTAMK